LNGRYDNKGKLMTVLKYCKPAMLLCGSLLFLTGCETAQDYSLTYKLWNNPELRRFAEPAPDPHLALFEKRSDHDVLVQYDETYEHNETVRRRAYFLAQNVRRIVQRKKPRFVNPQLAPGLTPLAIQEAQPGATNSWPPGGSPVAFYDKDLHDFSLQGIPGLEGHHTLPVYEHGSGNFARIALTPFAVTGDTVTVGVVAGVVFAYAYAAGQIYTVRAEEGTRLERLKDFFKVAQTANKKERIQ